MINSMKNCLWYKKPASDWNEALPLGSGRLGMMIFGQPCFETVQLNEESVWSGMFRNRNNPDALKTLPEVRRLLNEGDIRGAQKVAMEGLSGIPSQERGYQTAGNLNITHLADCSAGCHGEFPLPDAPLGGEDAAGIKQYRRELDISTAVASVSFEAGGIRFTREYFASAPDDVLIIRISADRPGAVSFRASLDRGAFEDTKGAADGRTIFMQDSHGIPFFEAVRAVTDGGSVRTAGEFLIVEEADDALLFVNIETAFRESDPRESCLKKLDKAVAWVDALSAEEALRRQPGSLDIKTAVPSEKTVAVNCSEKKAGTAEENSSDAGSGSTHLSSSRNCVSTPLGSLDDVSMRHMGTVQACEAALSAAETGNLSEGSIKTAGAAYAALKMRHTADYQQYFNRMELRLGVATDSLSEAGCTTGPEASSMTCALPTDERLARFRASLSEADCETVPESASKACGAADLDLIRLYADFGRYLLISSSRPGTLPANLQGIWCKDIESPWGSKYTININTEMNYWPAAMCNLAEMEEPLFSLLERMVPNGRETAKSMYGCRGFTAHHNTDIWGDTAPQDIWLPASYWVLGAAWLCTHVITHFEYTQDMDFLKRMYPVLHEACLFFVDFLTEGTEDITLADGRVVKNLTVNPSTSPENTYRLPNGQTGCMCPGCEMDNRILEQLFSGTILASALLGETEDVDAFKAVLERLLPPVVGSDGRIREWNGEFEEVEPGHRHISHLYGLFPGNTIHPKDTPELARAAEKTLEHRLSHGGGHTGWSRAWIINFYASLGNGEKAGENVSALLSKSTLSNMFDNHPPFQIDGNFGGLTGIIRMLVQSRIKDGQVLVELLPALPDSWQDGSVRGVALKGNLLADFEWKGGRLLRWSVYPVQGKTPLPFKLVLPRDR